LSKDVKLPRKAERKVDGSRVEGRDAMGGEEEEEDEKSWH
jgi:hypothetical protein